MYPSGITNKSSAFGRAFDISSYAADVKQRSTALYIIISGDGDKIKKLFIIS